MTGVERIHFWCEPDVPLDMVSEWDPDSEPWRFASGLGHNLLELYVRLRDRGYPVTLGPHVPRDAGLVVVYPSGSIWQSRRLARLGWRVRRHRVALLCSDLPPRYGALIRSDLQIMPNDRQASRKASSRYLPPLPQRGVVPRDPDVQATPWVLAFKGNPENAPEYLLDVNFQSALKALDIELDLDTPTRTDGSDQHWHDYSRTDWVLLDRKYSSYGNPAWKPPTKLLNAWHAGVIPLMVAEPAYVALARPGIDALMFDDVEELLAVLGELCSSPALREQLNSGIRARHAVLESSREVVDAYWRVFQEHAGVPTRTRAAISMQCLIRCLIRVRFVRIMDRLNRRLGARSLKAGQTVDAGSA